MKKNLFFLTTLLMLGISIYCSQVNSTENLSELQLANIEALASGESGTSNTGPAEEKRCYGGGHRMVCRCINSQPCTGTDCY